MFAVAVGRVTIAARRLMWALIFAFAVRLPWTGKFGRIYQWLVAGTILEFTVTIPVDVFVRRKSNCYCGEGTAIALLFGLSSAGLLFGPGVVLLSLRRWAQWRQATNTCLGCGYDLRGLPTPRCPECGRPFQQTAVDAGPMTSPR